MDIRKHILARMQDCKIARKIPDKPLRAYREIYGLRGD